MTGNVYKSYSGCTSCRPVGVSCPELAAAPELFLKDHEGDIGGPSTVEWLKMQKMENLTANMLGINPNRLDER